MACNWKKYPRENNHDITHKIEGYWKFPKFVSVPFDPWPACSIHNVHNSHLKHPICSQRIILPLRTANNTNFVEINIKSYMWKWIQTENLCSANVVVTIDLCAKNLSLQTPPNDEVKKSRLINKPCLLPCFSRLTKFLWFFLGSILCFSRKTSEKNVRFKTSHNWTKKIK